jgi:D-beta-D-heptose 7-phosphate kinase/D-beta-D-heptose 1-phosphate adenosyltransferase
MPSTLSLPRLKQLLGRARRKRIIVIGDVMLDQFLFGSVARISPEAPVPVVEFERETFMPGGAANVARNLAALGAAPEMFGMIGRDDAGVKLRQLLIEQKIDCRGLLVDGERPTSIKTRIVANQQQVVRVDRESTASSDGATVRRLLVGLEPRLLSADALIVGDYGKGVVTQPLLDALKRFCRARGIWLSLDPKPVHHLNLNGLSLVTPNRREAFELAEMDDTTRTSDPLKDTNLLRVGEKLLTSLQPALLLITLGDLGMLLFQRGRKPFHIPTVAQEVFDVSGAGDTVIGSFTLAIAAGASPIEAALISNFAAGVVVEKVGTATVTPEELLATFQQRGRRSG